MLIVCQFEFRDWLFQLWSPRRKGPVCAGATALNTARSGASGIIWLEGELPSLVWKLTDAGKTRLARYWHFLLNLSKCWKFSKKNSNWYSQAH
jgi:hypothetical protein